ncbi:MAG: hypothetical protein J6Y52_00315 [Bacteroidales bacterium]|nr:hypothetical protein [Bacteroidales bacterium]
MNNSFDIHRFGKLVLHDVRRCSPRYGTVGAVMISELTFTPLMVLSQNFLTQDPHGAGYRLSLMVLMSALIASTIPTQLYFNAGKKKTGIYFAMLPASKWEKYLSMALLSLVLVPLMLMVANVAIDSLLTAVHAPYYHKYLWQSEALQWIEPAMVCNCALAFIGPTLGFIYANTIQNKTCRNTMSIVLWLWLMGGVFSMMILEITDLAGIGWYIVAAQASLAALMGWLGWNKMNKMSY